MILFCEVSLSLHDFKKDYDMSERIGVTVDLKMGEVPQVRPWVRYGARMFDMYLFSIPAVFILSAIFPSILNMPEIVFGMLLTFIWVFVEASLLFTLGTTPGKSLFKITLRSSAEEKLSFSSAFNRSFTVWWKGLGLGFPIASLITLIIAHRTLSREGITSWDREGKFKITHSRIGSLRVIAAIIFFIGCLSLVVFSKIYEKSI